ncbi:MAG: baseplate J/gp47 family protein [Chloroflexi bacterium]|nr:baseplate J/gp47 family protein [Chloroflexota bacterium]
MASSIPSSRVVYASHGDDIAAVLVKLQRKRGTSVVLVGNNCPALHDRENLEFLQRQATDLELDLTLVCGDRGVRDSASDLGIKVVNSLGALHAPEQPGRALEPAIAGSASRKIAKTRAEVSDVAENTIRANQAARVATGQSNKRGGRGSLSIERSFSSILALATVVSVLLFIVWGAFYLVLPSAAIKLTPVQQRYSTVLQLLADPQVSRLNAATGQVPAQLVVIEETDEMTVPATGKRNEPTGRAEGSVVFRNRISQRVVVPKGTIVLTNENRRYVTAAEVNVPPTSGASSELVGRRVAVVAEEPGPIGNVGPSVITHIEDQSLNQRLIVNNDFPIQGGGERVVTFVTEQDRLQLFEQLRHLLMQRVWQQLGGVVNPVESSFVPWDDDVIVDEANYDRTVGEESDQVTLRMRVKLRGTAFSNIYLEEVAPIILARIVENQFEAHVLVSDTVVLGNPHVNSITDGVIQLTLEAQGDILSAWDHGRIRRDLANKTLEEAESYLGNLTGVGDFVLEMGPDWYDRMPRLWFRIDIEVREPIRLAA